MRFADYFLEENDFMFIDVIRDGERPWSAISSIGKMISGYISSKHDTGTGAFGEHAGLETFRLANEEEETALVVHRPFVTTDDVCLVDNGLFIGKGTFLEPGAIVKTPCLIGPGCEIRQGAYIRGNVIVGLGCVIGHVTEVKNSIFMNKSNAGHFAYVGDSIVGSRVNLGAGTILANLQFRTRREIDENSINEIVIRAQGKDIAAGRNKLGAVIGDYTEIGCNTVTAPGVCVGSQSWIYPNTAVPKGFYGPNSVLKNPGGASIEVGGKPAV